MRTITMVFLFVTAVSCGSRSGPGVDNDGSSLSGCQHACVEELEESLEQSFGATVDCADPAWAVARTCAACIQHLRIQYEVALTSEGSFCSRYFPAR
jgi:hypothetical protein